MPRVINGEGKWAVQISAGHLGVCSGTAHAIYTEVPGWPGGPTGASGSFGWHLLAPVATIAANGPSQGFQVHGRTGRLPAYSSPLGLPGRGWNNDG